ncbi:MAG: hypothetical protein J6K97_02600 [Clostridia bacterium]|nr:hypothetical protein [Clostridia bacterium]
MKTYSLFIIKPGYVAKKEEVLDLLNKNDIKVDVMEETVLVKEQVERHYEEHFGKSFYSTLVNYMTTGAVQDIYKFEPTCVKMVVTSAKDETEEEFITRSRAVVKEVLRPALTLKREDFAALSDEEYKELTMTANGIHASDKPESAVKEINNLFPKYFN